MNDDQSEYLAKVIEKGLERIWIAIPDNDQLDSVTTSLEAIASSLASISHSLVDIASRPSKFEGVGKDA